MSGRILISGAGIAGCCLAWWLQKYGYAESLAGPHGWADHEPAARSGCICALSRS
jgi:2-polyprenyl-6-methoxyphenol hydroxylase-like FAD-dependent oxidoreductase